MKKYQNYNEYINGDNGKHYVIIDDKYRILRSKIEGNNVIILGPKQIRKLDQILNIEYVIVK